MQHCLDVGIYLIDRGQQEEENIFSTAEDPSERDSRAEVSATVLASIFEPAAMPEYGSPIGESSEVPQALKPQRSGLGYINFGFNWPSSLTLLSQIALHIT